MIDPQLVETINGETNFERDMIEQVLYMKEVLMMIFNDPVLKKSYVLIGGTAINLFNSEIPRLSVDIDLDYIHLGKKSFSNDIIENHARILERISKEINMDYYRTTDTSLKRLGIILKYKSNFIPEGEGSVKLDISYLLETTILPPTKKSIVQLGAYDGFKNLRILVANPHELWAGKALALVYKSSKDPKPKDIVDLYSMFIARHLFDIYTLENKLIKRKISLNQRILRIAFIFKGVSRIKEFYLLRGEQLKRCSPKEIERQLYPYLRLENKPKLEDMKVLSRQFLDRICSNNWNKNQKRFVDEFQSNGNYYPELLLGKDNKTFSHLYSNEYMIDIAKKFVK